MNRGIAPIFIIIIAAVAIIGGGFLVLQNRTGSSELDDAMVADEGTSGAMEGESVADDASTTEGTVSSTEGSFFDMLASGGARECTWTIPPVDGQEFEPGTVWFDGVGRARSTFSSTTSEGTVTVNGIMRDKKLYSWVNFPGAGTFGIQMDQEKVENFEQLPPEQREQARAYQEEVEFDCKSWVVDRSLFEVPQDITFQSF